MNKDIPVEVVNEAKNNMKVVVFTKNDGAPESYYCAWQVLNVSPSTTEKFIYPAETSLMLDGPAKVCIQFLLNLEAHWKFSTQKKRALLFFNKVGKSVILLVDLDLP